MVLSRHSWSELGLTSRCDLELDFALLMDLVLEPDLSLKLDLALALDLAELELALLSSESDLLSRRLFAEPDWTVVGVDVDCWLSCDSSFCIVSRTAPRAPRLSQ